LSRLAPSPAAGREGAEAKGGALRAVLEVMACQGEKRGGVGMVADHFKGGGNVDQLRVGGRSGVVPRSEEVGEGADPTGRWRAAGNSPTVALTGGTRVGGAE
jgi:hypothetical protein